MNFKKKLDFDINIFGLGYVGLTLAAKLLNSGLKVNGFEINNKILFSLNEKKEAHFKEPEINKILKKAILKKRFNVSRNLDRKIFKKSINIITIGTPIIRNKIFLKSIFSVINEIKKKLQNDDSIIILRSTVKIGTTRKLEKKFNKKINFAFCPERTIEGAALKELSLNPQIIATENPYAKKIVQNFFSIFNKNTIHVNQFEKAETIKLFDNTYRDISFSIGNEFGRICHNLGFNGNEIIKLCNKNYSRTNISMPGTVGGPCLEKDPYILLESIKIRKKNLIFISRKINENMIEDGLKEISKKINLKKINSACIIGLAFKGKPITNDLRGSLAIKIIKKLKKFNNKIDLFGLDPNIKIEEFQTIGLKKFNKKLKYDLVIIQNNAEFIKKIGINNLKKNIKKNGIIYDFWSLFNDNSSKYLTYA
jgi:UDP-N-acetyl-D-mannosaminuronic acid dehydrogenase